MSLDKSLQRLTSVVTELEKFTAEKENDIKGRQIDLFGTAPRSITGKNPTVDNTLMAKTLDRTIERIENLLQVGSR